MSRKPHKSNRHSHRDRPLDETTNRLRDCLGDLGAWLEETEQHRRDARTPRSGFRARVA